MITNTGKEIIAKYLMGTAPAYASYLALGCGAKPRPNIDTVTGASSVGGTITVTDPDGTEGLWIGAKINIISGTGSLSTTQDTLVTAITGSTTFTVSPSPTAALSSAVLSIQTDPSKEVLDFEMFRVPIASRGYINDDGVNKIVLTAELPTEERYEISEIGVFSAGANSDAGSYDSKTITTFADTENWQFVDGLTVTNPTLITTSLIDNANIITTNADAIQTNANNAAFLNTTRASRYERCRYFNNILMLRGNTSKIIANNGSYTIGADPKILQLTGQTVDLTRNSTSDLLKVAFALVNKNGDSSIVPDFARVIVEFSNSDGSQYARLIADASDTDVDFSTNRYCVITKRLDQLVYFTSNPVNPFSWNNVTSIKVYASVIKNVSITNKEASALYVTLTTSTAHNLNAGDTVVVSGIDARCNGTFEIYDTPTPTTFRYYSPGDVLASTPVSPAVTINVALSTFFIALDAIRLDNISTVNPLYGMTGYAMIQNENAETIIKSPNTTNYVEFRFIVDVT